MATRTNKSKLLINPLLIIAPRKEAEPSQFGTGPNLQLGSTGPIVSIVPT